VFPARRAAFLRQLTNSLRSDPNAVGTVDIQGVSMLLLTPSSPFSTLPDKNLFCMND
jgi:hypothetical protein